MVDVLADGRRACFLGVSPDGLAAAANQRAAPVLAELLARFGQPWPEVRRNGEYLRFGVLPGPLIEDALSKAGLMP